MYRYRKATKSNSIEGKGKACSEYSGSGEEIESKRVSKGGGQTMERDDEPGSIGRTRVACQPLFPGKTPIRAAYKTRREPSRSERRSWGYRG